MGRTTTVAEIGVLLFFQPLDTLREEEGCCRGASSSFVSNTCKVDLGIAERRKKSNFSRK